MASTAIRPSKKSTGSITHIDVQRSALERRPSALPRELHIPEILADVFVVLVCGYVAYLLRSSAGVGMEWWAQSRFYAFYLTGYAGISALFAAACIMALDHKGLYRRIIHGSVVDEGLSVLNAIGVSTMVLLAYLFMSNTTRISRLWVLSTAAASYFVLMGVRMLRRQRLKVAFAKGIDMRNALIIGAGSVGHALAQHLSGNTNFGYRVKGFLDDDRMGEGILGPVEKLESVAKSLFIDDVFITNPSERDLVKQLTIVAPKLGLNISVVPELFDGIGWNAPFYYLGPFPMMALHKEEPSRFQLFWKRSIDVVLSALGLLVLAPFFALVAVVIKLDSDGPVFFRPLRIGRKGNPFVCLKFRTMEDGADKKLKDVLHMNERQDILFKMKDDPRVTRIGALLRKSSLDELPQLWNVLVGDMSLVGPRPPEVREYDQYEVGHLRRLQVTPGITGLWQVTARQDPSFETYLRLDLQYIENWSLWLDFKILLKTIPAVVRGTGQ